MLSRKNIKGSICLVLLSLWTSVACATLDPQQIPQENERQPLDSLELRAGIEPYFRRVDIIRQQDCTTTTTVNADGTTSTSTQCNDRPYYPLGLFMGNGLFLDAVGNLSIDLVTLVGLSNQKSFTISQTYEGFFSDSTHTMVRDGDRLTVTVPGLFSDSTIEYQFTRNGMKLDDGSEFVKDANGVRRVGIEKFTLFGLDLTGDPPEVKRKSEHSYEVGSFFVKRNTDGSITIGEDFTIDNQGKQITMERPGGFLIGDTQILLFQGQNKLAVIDGENPDEGFVVDWSNESIKVTEARGTFGYPSERVINITRGN